MKNHNTMPNNDSEPIANDTASMPQAADAAEPSGLPSFSCHELWKVMLLFIAILALFFSPAAFQGKMIYSGDLNGSDLLDMNVPRRVLAANAVRDGELPLWEPRLSDGMCLFAEGQAGTFYPTTLPLYLVFSPTHATTLSILSTLLVAMLGCYAWSRLYGIQPLPSLIGAVAFGLGGAFIFRLKFLNMIQVIAWMPWSFWALRAYKLSAKRVYLLALLAVWTFQILAGHPHVCYICWLASYMYGLALAWEFRHQPNGQPWYRFLAVMLATTAATVLLCSVQLLPTWELTQNSLRGQAIEWNDLYAYPLKVKHLARFVAPYCLGNPAIGTHATDLKQEGFFWESLPYFGIIPLLLALLAVFAKRPNKAAIIALGLLTLLCLLAAFGPQGGVYWLFWKFCPAFNLFRFPARMLIPTLCFSSLLAAWGAQSLYEWLGGRYSRKVAATALAALIAATGLELYHTSSQYQEYLPGSWEQPPASIKLLGKAQRVYSPLYIFTWDRLLNEQGWLGKHREIVHHLASLTPDSATIWGIQCPSDSILFDGGITLSLYMDVQGWQYSSIFSSLAPDKSSFDIMPDAAAWLRLQGISHVLSFMPLRNVASNPSIAGATVYSAQDSEGGLPPLYIYAIREPLPKARLVAPDLTKELPAFAQFIRDNYPTYQDGSLYEPSIGDNPSVGKATVSREGHCFITIDTECERDSFLIVSNTYHQYWQASIDGSAAQPVERVNYAFQGVPLPAGRHQVTLRFSSPAFSLGWKISAGMLILLIVCGAVGLFRSGTARQEQHGAALA
ncbi:YfhO family protein [bacterium]|nr:YfhO family protein [bacterium]